MKRKHSIIVAILLSAALPLAGQDVSPVTRTVDLDGASLRVRTAGLESRKKGDPAVVFESGASAPLETWDPVLPAVTRFAAVVAYDRAGTGLSPWDGQPPTPERVGTRLRQLLGRLGIAPPFVLVGHSWGGALVRYFAGNHASEIAGVLYIDPTDVTLTKADMIAMFESIGARAADYESFRKTMDDAMSAAPPALRAEAGVITAILDSDPDRRALPPPPRVPTAMIVAGRVGVPPQSGMPFDTKAYAKAMHESQVTRLRRWVPEGGTFEVATDAGHSVHRDNPQLVIDTIRRLVQPKP